MITKPRAWPMWLLAAALTAGVIVPAAGAGAAVPSAPGARSADNTAPCSFAKVAACQSTDPTIKTYVGFMGDTTGCTFDISVDWGDNSKAQQVFFTSPPDGTAFLAQHSYAYRDTPMTFTITVSGTVTAGQCFFNPFTLSFTLLTCTAAELSGPSWAGTFPDSRSVAELSAKFRKDVSAFIAAMRRARIKVNPISTRRPAERAYLMHYSWLVANRKLSALKVPRFTGGKHERPVGICWVHVGAHGADLGASVTAAGKLAAAFRIRAQRTAPALKSLRTEGLAIEMATTWTSRKITIVNASGHAVTIKSTPHTGSNKALIAVGASYGVIHFANARQAPDDWSVNGH